MTTAYVVYVLDFVGEKARATRCARAGAPNLSSRWRDVAPVRPRHETRPESRFNPREHADSLARVHSLSSRE